MPTQEAALRGECTDQNVGPGDQTIAIAWNPGVSNLDYYARSGSTPSTFNVLFSPQNPVSTGTIQVDFGPQQPLRSGWQQFTFSRALQMTINNQADATKYGWVIVK